MSMDFGLLAGAAGCAIGAASIFISDRRNRDAKLAVELIREEASCCETRCVTGIGALARQLDDLQLSMQNAEETLRDGRLSRSARAHAFETLRTGISPDTAASRLGMPKNDIRLLAKISNLLSPYR